MTYQQAVQHCRYWANEIQAVGVDALVKDYEAAIGISDQLVYPLDMQKWITKKITLCCMTFAYMQLMLTIATQTEHHGSSCWR